MSELKTQLQYLNPLRVAALDLRRRIADASSKISEDDQLLRNTLDDLSGELRKPAAEFAKWANGFGQYALSTIYMALVYFARSSRIRSELPFVQLASGDDEALLGHVERVRRALGGPNGIWESMQDSLGSYVSAKDATLLNYRDFCLQLADPKTGHWYERVRDFFHDLHLKTPAERDEMLAALDELARFLGEKPRQTARGEGMAP